MRLSGQDKNELLKAAWKGGTTGDAKGLANYLVSLVDVIDSLPDNKSDAPAPTFRLYEVSVPTPALPVGTYSPSAHWPNGLYQQSLSGDE